MKWIGKYISYMLLFFGLGVVFLPEWYVFELAVSFLPYMVALHMFLAGYWLSRIFFVYRGLFVFFALMHIVGFLYFLQPMLQFYNQGPIDSSSDGGITVLYSNVSKVNYRYDDIIETIQYYDPDVIMFVEFADHHSDALKPFLSEYYPYINRTSWSRTFVGSMVFSRYPIDDLADDFVEGAWRYGYFRIDSPDSSYYVYLVHTSSPISPENYRMRNNQLATLAEHIDMHAAFRGSWPVLLVGDLNVTPWSVHYDRFVSALRDFENMGRWFPLLFTWGLEWLPLFRAHIDHVFVSDPNVITHIEQISLPGSDHKGYYFVLQ